MMLFPIAVDIDGCSDLSTWTYIGCWARPCRHTHWDGCLIVFTLGSDVGLGLPHIGSDIRHI